MPTPYKILVVDDEADLEPLMLQRMRRQMRSGQYTFVFARNGVEALEILNRDESIDMVISDINMPQMDGLTLLNEISKLDTDIRAIIISAYGDMDNIRSAMNRGAFDFVTKPLDFLDLRTTIDRTLAHLEEWREAMATRDRLVSLQNELNVATGIQRSILPTVFPSGPGYQTHAGMEPARNVGGDFYDFIALHGDRIGLAVADVSDKGVPAALFMMSSRTLLKGSAIGTMGPGATLSEVNQLLCEENEAMMFVTLLYGTYSPSSGKFVYANGGHNPPLVVHPDGSSTILPPTGGMALGVEE
ncbi:MAG: SpoIIE family protein phosphatase, partial [Dehalococcoidia bacterium]|nr:SpoIIE family protein phosphatase [Dehalococcoidia bacterium]